MLDETNLLQRLGAEALGTAFLVFIGVGSVPATLIVNGDAPFTMADLGMISLAFGTIVVATVYALGHIGGNHINPAVTVGLAATGKFPWSQVPAYIAAQVVGAIVGAAAIIGVLGMTASDVGLGVAAYNEDTVSMARAFTAEFVGTFILVFTIFGVIHRKAAAGFAGVAIGLVVFAAIIPVAPTTGASINPARTFGPMLVQQIAGGEVQWEPAARLPRGRAPRRSRRRPALRPAQQDSGRRRAGRGRGPRRPRSRVGQRPLSPVPPHQPSEGSLMKKLINDPNDVVVEALLGIEAAHPDLQVDHHNKIIYRGDVPKKDKVGLISGGGSGHEPLHGGFVGLGMLDAACAGEVFTSPVPDQMLAATKLVDGGAGVLHIVKNYTGDVMNFEMAAELAAAETGARVVSVVTDDDVAVQDSTWTAGRRGVGVTVLLEKIAGAAAEQGRDLDQVAEVARTVNANGRSMGVALTSCTVPAAGKPTFDLGEDEMELGVGIHGEPGRERLPLAPASEIAEMLVEPILADLPFTKGDPVIAFVNGLGGTPLIELYVLYNEVNKILSGHGVTIARSLVGSYITSLDMAGASVTLLKVDDELLSLWDAPVNTAALRWGI